MTKQATSKKRKFCLNDMPIIKSKKNKKLIEHDPAKFFKLHPNFKCLLAKTIKENEDVLRRLVDK